MLPQQGAWECLIEPETTGDGVMDTDSKEAITKEAPKAEKEVRNILASPFLLSSNFSLENPAECPLTWVHKESCLHYLLSPLLTYRAEKGEE